MAELLDRYSAAQLRVIDDYWDAMRFTRRAGKVSEGVREKEMTYWARFPADVVTQALQIHIDRHQNLREQYTRGIIRNLAREMEGNNGHLGKGFAGKHEVSQRAGGQPGKRERNARAADAFRGLLK